MADIKWTFFADTNAAERAIQALEQKYNNLEQGMKRTARSSKTSHDSMISGLTAVGTKIAATVTAYAGLGTVINGILAGNQRMIAQAEEAGAKYDELFRKFRIQGGLSDIQSKAAQGNILKVSQAVGFSAEQGAQAATQLVSSGFSAEQAQGPALAPFLKTLAASNMTGKEVDSTSLARAMTAYLNSQGMDLNAANMEKAGVGMQRLFKSQDIQLADMESLAKVGSVFRGKLSMEEQFSAMASLKNSGLQGGEAATALRNMVMAMTTQGMDKKKVQALAGLGLKPGDIDLQGETFTEALGTMSKAFAATDDLKYGPLMKQFFEKEGVASVTTVVNDAQKIAAMNTLQGDMAGFNADVGIATSGRNAAGRRLDLQNEAIAAEQDAQYGNWAKAIELYGRQKGGSNFGIAGDVMAFEAARGVGVSPENAAWFATGDSGGVQALLEQANKAAADQTEVLKDISTTLKERPTQIPNRNAHTESARGN